MGGGALKKKRKGKHSDLAKTDDVDDDAPKKAAKGKKKRVSFG